MSDKTQLQGYIDALRINDLDTLCAIELEHGLYGYPPEVVGVGLAAVDRGGDAQAAVDEYISRKD